MILETSFKLNKEKDSFNLELIIIKSLNIIKTSLEANNIVIETKF